MNGNNSKTVFIILGAVGLLMTLAGLGLLTKNYLGELLASPGNAISQESTIDSEATADDPSLSSINLSESTTRTPQPTSTSRPTQTDHPISVPTSTSAATPTSTNTPTPTANSPWLACPGLYLSQLHIGDRAYVSYEPPLSNRVRTSPTTEADVLGKIQPGEKVEVIDGPACSDGWIWWRVSSEEQNLVGWTSEGDGEDYWLIKIDE